MKTQKSASKQSKPIAKHQPIAYHLKKDVMIDGWMYKAGETIYRIESDTKPRTFYTLVKRSHGLQCTCDGAAYTSHCRHVRRVEKFLLFQALQENMDKFWQAVAQYATLSAKSEQEYQDKGYLVDAPKPGKLQCPWQKQYAGDPREKMLSAPLNSGDRAFSLLKR